MTKKVVKGPWKPRPWEDATADEQMLRMFNAFLASARKKTKQAVYVLLAEYIVTGVDLENAKSKDLK
jgi:hypothetical protein